MIDWDRLDKKYDSKNELIKRHPSCSYCPYEEILKPNQRTVDILDKEIPNGNHPHRETIEQVCGQDMDEVCDMKYAAMRAPVDDFMLAQLGAVGTYKYDLGKAYQRQKNNPVTFQEAFLEWVKPRTGVSEVSYAKRFRETWNKSIDIAGKHTLTEEGIYRIAMADQETYDAQSKVFELLDENEEERDVHGARQ